MMRTRISCRNEVDVHPLPSELGRVCKSCLVPSLPSNRYENSLRTDVDAHPLPSELERVCERCLVPSLPSSRKVYSLPNDVDAHFLPDELERVCESCQVPSLCLDSPGNVCTMHEYKTNKTCSDTRLHDEVIPVTEWHV